jgi:hypothetical protein
MALDEQVDGLQLRGVLALTVRTSRRLLPLIDLEPGVEEIARQGLGIASDFVEGAGLARLQNRVVIDGIERIKRGGAAWQAAVETARAGEHAARFQWTHNPESAHVTLRHARASIRCAEDAAGRYLGPPFERDRAAVSATHSGDVNDLGEPLDLNAFGPLGLLWDLREDRPPWMPSLPRPVIMTPDRYAAPEAMKAERAEFVCFDGRNGLGAAYDTLKVLAERGVQTYLSPRPGIFVYAPDADATARLELNAFGAVVITNERLCGHVPHNATEFADLLVAQMHETRAEWLVHQRVAHRREQEALEFAQASPVREDDKPDQPVPSQNTTALNCRYERILEDLLDVEGRNLSH